MIPVMEIFGPTIQGEGPHVGLKTLFVRVAGCDFKCEWCDSKFAWNVPQAVKYKEEELAEALIEQCKQTHTSNVILTGGNPCLYDFESVIDALKDHNITIDVETQGSILPKWLNKVDLVVISPKAPSSKQPDVFENVDLFCKYRNPDVKVAIKIPVFNDEDFDFVGRYYTMVTSTALPVELYISVGNTDTSEEGSIATRVLKDYEKLINKVASSNMDRVFILPQVHTLVWGNKQGV